MRVHVSIHEAINYIHMIFNLYNQFNKFVTFRNVMKYVILCMGVAIVTKHVMAEINLTRLCAIKAICFTERVVLLAVHE